MEDNTPSTPPPEEGGAVKKKFGLFRHRGHHEETQEADGDDERNSPEEGKDDGDAKSSSSGGLGSKIKQKKVQRQEKKERREQRKDMKKNPQFDFIETNNEPATLKKKDIKMKKKEDKGTCAAIFNFTEENKHLKGQPRVSRQMVRALKSSKNSASGPGPSSATSAIAAGGASGPSMGPGPSVGAVAGLKGEKGMTKVDLEDFLLRHPMHRMRGTTWNYMHLVKGQGTLRRETMIVIVGGGVRVEVFFEMLESLVEDFDVLAPLVPSELSTFEDYVAGINLLRAHLGIAEFHLLGVCFGGIVALHYASVHPQLLRSLVLSHTPPPNAEFGRACQSYLQKLLEHNRTKPGNQVAKEVEPPSALQRVLLGYMVRSKDIARDVPQVMTTEGVLRLWKRLVRRFALDLNGISSKLEALSKYNQETHYSPETFAALRCPVLLMDSERRDAFGVKSFEELKVLFPNAQTNFMEGFGHLVVLIKGHEVGTQILKWYSENFFQQNL